jgi:hypothetical protein
VDQVHDGASLVRGTPGTTRPRSLPVAAGDEDGDEAELVRGSLELELRRRGGTTKVKNSGALSST